MADYKKLIYHILKWEGGWSDDKDDKGGVTMIGITLTTYVTYCKRKNREIPDMNDLRHITIDEWNDIFKTLYWDRWKGDSIEDQNLANILVDWVWCSGSNGIKIPQRLIGVEDDGIVGIKTLSALNGVTSRKALFESIKSERIAFCEKIARKSISQAKFLNGWKNRINDLNYE